MDAQQVVLQFPAQALDLLLPLEMSEYPVAQEKLPIQPRDRAAQVREVVQLAEGASEGRLAALVGPGNDQHPLMSLQVEIVDDNGAVLGHELFR